MFDKLINAAGRVIEGAVEDAILEAAHEVMHGSGEGRGRRRKGCISAWLREYREHPGGLHLVIGRQRSGKTALCYYLAQQTGKPIYAMTAASEVPPEVRVIYNIDVLPPGSICVVDDASLFFNSMRRDGDAYMALRDAAIVSEKQDISFLINVHDSSLLNKTAMSQCKSIFFKEPNLMSTETERPGIRRMIEQVQQGFNKIPKTIRNSYFFLYSSDCKGWGKAPLPAGWSQKVSTSLAFVRDAEFEEIDEVKGKEKENQPMDGDTFEEFKRKHENEKGNTKDNPDYRSH